MRIGAEHGDPRIALVKLDVDGYECDVLEGGDAPNATRSPDFRVGDRAARAP